MSPLVTTIGLRLVLAAIIYIATTSYWVSNTRGWESLGIFAMSILFGVFAAASLLISMVIARRITNRWLRVLAHSPIVLAIFGFLGYVIVGAFMGMRNDVTRDMLPFAGLVAVIAVVDALAGYALDGWADRRQSRSAV